MGFTVRRFILNPYQHSTSNSILHKGMATSLLKLAPPINPLNTALPHSPSASSPAQTPDPEAPPQSSRTRGTRKCPSAGAPLCSLHSARRTHSACCCCSSRCLCRARADRDSKSMERREEAPRVNQSTFQNRQRPKRDFVLKSIKRFDKKNHSVDISSAHTHPLLIRPSKFCLEVVAR